MDAVDASLKLQPVRDQFLVRFYRWARNDMFRESENGFPFVRRVTNPSALRFVRFAEQLRAHEASIFYSALVKRSHRRAVAILQEPLSSEENALLERYRSYRAPPLLSHIPADRTRRAKFRKTLLSTLSAALNGPVEFSARHELWIYQEPIGPWTLRTCFDTGGKRLLAYWHTIVAREPVLLCDQISLLTWLGISQTEWTNAQEKEYAGIAQCLAELHAHFMVAAPQLLEGLSHELPEIEARSWRDLVTVKGHRENGMTIVLLDSTVARRLLGNKATWEIPTSIIPEHLRAVGSHFCLIQDPVFSRESDDPVARSTTYRHLRVEPVRS